MLLVSETLLFSQNSRHIYAHLYSLAKKSQCHFLSSALWRAIMTSWFSPEPVLLAISSNPVKVSDCFWNLYSSFCLSLSGTFSLGIAVVLRALEASRSSVAARKNDIRPLTVSCFTQCNRAGITICPYLTAIAKVTIDVQSSAISN